jgi:hypothetical protein
MSKQAASRTVTVHVPLKFSVRAGRKAVTSEIAPACAPSAKTEDALLKALAKAFRWRKRIEEGEYASITELAKANGVNDSYACRLLRLTLLCPGVIATILSNRQGAGLTLKQLTKPMPIEWVRQTAAINRAECP